MFNFIIGILIGLIIGMLIPKGEKNESTREG